MNRTNAQFNRHRPIAAQPSACPALAACGPGGPCRLFPAPGHFVLHTLTPALSAMTPSIPTQKAAPICRLTVSGNKGLRGRTLFVYCFRCYSTPIHSIHSFNHSIFIRLTAGSSCVCVDYGPVLRELLEWQVKTSSALIRYSLSTIDPSIRPTTITTTWPFCRVSIWKAHCFTLHCHPIYLSLSLPHSLLSISRSLTRSRSGFLRQGGEGREKERDGVKRRGGSEGVWLKVRTEMDRMQ